MRKQVLPHRVVTVTLITAALLALAGGCGGSKRQPRAAGTGTSVASPNPASPETVEALRRGYSQSYPNSRLGVVVAARPQNQLVAVGQIPLDTLADNQVVTFMDANQRVLTTGTIVRLLPESAQVHARYDAPTANGREPRAGDIMVRF
ncbi:MAG TPA: hypothetical protein VER17_16075 [Tepidisphaeraceae bacterium]|nr:hypothetical protein [Tepidisphaeraceae bacterium]